MSSPSAEAPIHQLLAGRFRVESELGEGGMARVYRVIDLTTGRPLALKLLRAGIASEGEAVERLRREGEVLTRLKHPAVVRIETYGALDDGRLYLAMELLEGETLGGRMRRGKLSPAEICPILTGAAAGLTAAHEAGVVHRDLKPDNIFLCSRGDGLAEQVKLLDFGISKVVDYERLTRTGQILGTPRYMAPEQLAADNDLGAQVDIYALGVILYEALAGHPPFIAASPSDLIVAVLNGKVVPLRSYRPDISSELEGIVSRAMSRDVDARYDTAHELAAAFVDVARPRTVKAALRPGQRTKLVGSFAPGELPDADAAPGLRPGTFSAVPLAPEDEPRRRAPALVASKAPAAAPSAAHVPATVRARPGASARPRSHGADSPVRSPAARPAPARPAAPRPSEPSHTSMSSAPAYPPEDTGSIDLPMASNRPWLVLAALIAGGVSAALVLALLHVFFDRPQPTTNGATSDTVVDAGKRD